ncbi:MAG: TetR/AcrR family transcriptional regulator [Hyphomicrobiales bacterium]|nr:TetR/AcrR family transcriptional regulator [Hyphomicrobiales bacterium]
MTVQHLISLRKLPSQTRSEALVDAIIEAAVRILLRDGYPKLTTKTVAEVAGVSVGSLYQYFPNKQAILAEIIRRRTGEIVTALLRACEGAETVEAFSQVLVMTFLSEKHKKAALSAALREPMAEIDGRAIMEEGLHDLVRRLSDVLPRVLTRPLTPEEANRLALAVVAIEGAVSALIKNDPDALNQPATRETLTVMFYSGLGLDS